MLAANVALKQEVAELRKEQQEQQEKMQAVLDRVVADLQSTTTTTSATATTTTTTYVPATCNGVDEPASCGTTLLKTGCDDDQVRTACPTMCDACTTTSTTTSATTITATTITATTITSTTFAGKTYCADGTNGFHSGKTMCVVTIVKPADIVLRDDRSYHVACQMYGLSAYSTTDGNAACRIGHDHNYPNLVDNCNMGDFADFKANVAVPYYATVWWISTFNNGIGVEWNAAGPCDKGTTMNMCGRASNDKRGLDHGLNPVYSSNYNKHNVRLEVGDGLVCAKIN